MTKDEKEFAYELRELNKRYAHVGPIARWSGLMTSALAVANAGCIRQDSRMLTEHEWNVMCSRFFQAMTS